MALDVGNLLGSVNAAVTGFSDNRSLKKFISTMDKLGVQITSRYEAIFSGIPQATFFIQNISTPSMRQNSTTVYFDARAVEIPQNFEYEHEFSVTVINDSSGYIYSALTTFLMGDTARGVINSGYTMSIRAIGDDTHSGSTIMLNGVRIKNVGGLNYDNSGGDVQTFTVNLTAIDFSVTPGEAQKAAGITNAIGNLIG